MRSSKIILAVLTLAVLAGPALAALTYNKIPTTYATVEKPKLSSEGIVAYTYNTALTYDVNTLTITDQGRPGTVAFKAIGGMTADGTIAASGPPTGLNP